LRLGRFVNLQTLLSAERFTNLQTLLEIRKVCKFANLTLSHVRICAHLVTYPTFLVYRFSKLVNIRLIFYTLGGIIST